MSDMHRQDATPVTLFKVSESANEHPAAGWGRNCLSEPPGQRGSWLHHYERARP